MTDSHRDPSAPGPDAAFEQLLRTRLHQLADHAPTTVHSLDDIRVQHHTGRANARREGRHRRTAGIGATVAALLGAAGFTAVALTGAGTAGAASPEEAVRAFLEATANEDIFGMIDALDPSEVPAARSSSERGRAEAVDADLLNEGFSLDGIAGLDVAFDQLELVTETVADGVAVVNAAAGTASWTFDPAAFPLGAQLQEAFGADLALTTDSAALLDVVSPAMLATVERDGRWFVSVGYTVAEYARQAADLPMPDAALTAVGAASPEAAADEFLANLVSLDLAGAFATAAPGEGDALLRYAPLMIDAAADDIAGWQAEGFGLQLSDTSYVVEGSGSRRTLVAERFTIDGTVPEPEVYGFFDPSLPTVIYAFDGSEGVVLEAGVPIPATIEGLVFDPGFVFPDGEVNFTSANPDGTIIQLPEQPGSDGPDTFRIERADGCTTWSGEGATAMFGPTDLAMASSASGSSVDEAPVQVSTYADALGYEQIGDDAWRSCAPARGGLGLIAMVSTSGLTDLPTLEVVEVDGQWYVSPIGSVARIVVDLLASVRASGSLLDSQLAVYVLGTDRRSLETMFVGQTIESLSPACGLIVATDGSTITGLASDDLDLGDVRACMTGSWYADDVIVTDGSLDGITFSDEAPSPVEATVPASTMVP